MLQILLAAGIGLDLGGLSEEILKGGAEVGTGVKESCHVSVPSKGLYMRGK